MRPALLALLGALAGCWCVPDWDPRPGGPPVPEDASWANVGGISGPRAGDGCATFVGSLCEHDLVARGWTDASGWHSLEYRCPPGRGMADLPGCVEEQYEASTGFSIWCGP